MRLRTSLVLLAAVGLLAGCTTTPTSTTPTPPTGTLKPADFGDAPDGGATGYPTGFAAAGAFPTLFAHNGARALDVSQARLGPNASVENDANDAADPDGVPNLPANGDRDDGIVQLVMVLTSIPPPATLTVRATAPAGSAGGAFYVNALIDLNMDGRWGGAVQGGQKEWVAQNVPVTLAAGETKDVETPTFGFANGLILPDGAWMRVAITKEQVSSADWDGTGEFSAGEVEDHVVKLPLIDGKKGPIPVMDCPDHVDMTGKNVANFQCTLTNVGAAGKISWTMNVVKPGVNVAPAAGVENLGAGAAKNLAFTGTKVGNLPSVWKYTAVGIDPPSTVTAEGVFVGYGDSEGETSFDGGCSFFVGGVQTGRQHFTGESDAIFTLLLQTAGGAAFANKQVLVTGNVTAPGGYHGTLEATGTTDAQGHVETRHRVYSYNDYTLSGIMIESEGCTHDASADKVKQATAAVQP